MSLKGLGRLVLSSLPLDIFWGFCFVSRCLWALFWSWGNISLHYWKKIFLVVGAVSIKDCFNFLLVGESPFVDNMQAKQHGRITANYG